MQVTNIIKVNAQIISGPDNVPSGTYSVPGLNPYVKYIWDGGPQMQVIEGASSYTLSPNPPVATGAENESVAVTWDLCAPIHRFEVKEEPLFGNLVITLDADPDNVVNNTQYPEDLKIQEAIDDIVATGPNGLNGRGTVHLNVGVYYIETIKLAAGVRIEGAGPNTILKRTNNANALPPLDPPPPPPLPDPCTPAQRNHNKMLTTYWTPTNSIRQYSFLPLSDMNSSPIEISNLTIDGNKIIEPALIPYCATVDSWENSALIYLTAPYTVPLVLNDPDFYGPQWVKGPDDPVLSNGTLYQHWGTGQPNDNPYISGGSGKLKVFIHDVIFKNSGGDAVTQDGNVDLTMNDCEGTDIYRGTHTITTGADIARLKNVNTYTTDPLTISTKSIDYEVLVDQYGYNESYSFRTWIDDCDFDKNVQFDYWSSKLLLTNTHVLNPPTTFTGYVGGDIVTDACSFAFKAFDAGVNPPNQILAATHAKFKTTVFNIIGSLPLASYFNGVKFSWLAGPPNYGSHLGFENCHFNNVGMFLPSYGIYMPADANNANTVQFYFNNCSTANTSPNAYNGLLHMFNAATPPLASPNPVEPGVVNMNQVYTGGESEEQMKTHFGIRNIIQPAALAWSNITFNNITCNDPLADNGLINVSATSGFTPINYTFQWPPNNSQTLPTGLFSPIVENVYTVTVTDAAGCTLSTIIELLNPSGPGYNFCACSTGEVVVATPNVILKVAPTASDLLFKYGVGNTITGKTFYIDDVFTIDDNIIFDNCTLWFTQSGQIVFAGPLTLDVSNSILQASCDWWLGIEANAPQQKVAIDQSTIRDMQNGILIANDAVLEATNSNFLNNANRSIKFSGMNDPAYSGFVEGNTFDGMQYECAHGIEIFNSNYINIGNAGNINSGNTFKELNNGIDIRGDASIGAFLGPSNQIGVYNNKFEDIQANPPNQSLVDINNTVYTSPIGAGVNIDYTLAANTFSGHTTISYTGANTSATILFDQCSKGIVSQNNNLIAEKLYMKDTWFGIMNRNMASKEVYLALNKIENTAIGTQLIGNYDNYDVIENDIILNEGIGAPYNGNPQQVLIYPAIGIDIKQLNPPYNPAETFNILTNTITIPYWAGKGIGNLGANKSQLISNNNIFFTVPNGTAVPQVPAYDPSLYGIHNSNCKQMKLDNNLVEGQYSLMNYDLTFSKAYYFETSHDMVLTCNKGGATKQGFYVFGSCTTDVDKVQFNKFRFNLNPLYTLDNGAAQVGTFGDIGDGVTDNGNDWTYNMGGNTSWLQGNLFKVWRNSSVQPGFVINTTSGLLLDAESGSPGGILYPYRYLVPYLPNMTYTVTCDDPNFGNANPPNLVYNQSEIDIENAEAVALQQQTYINYAEVGQWLNNRNLYEQLALDTALRNSSLILSNFFNNYANSTIHDITQTDIALSVLFDFKGAEIEMIDLYNAAIAENNNITSNNDYELYEQTINNFALRLTRYGKDSISELQKTELAFIAHLCPFVGGSAVYKARVLWGMYSPITQYNDRLTCTQGQNKNGNSGYVNLDSLYEAQANEQGAIIASQLQVNVNTRPLLHSFNSQLDEIQLYPNPASTHIIVSYRSMEDGRIKLFNALGEVVLRTMLSKENSKTQIIISDLANGIYHYEIEFAGMEKKIGKLNIIN